ncbi:MAG: sigma-E processing peptidase SpoIIGA [Bacilli bacterium]|nr:sigma-E processing peptidase SpoIIGA [Bacilli bacterium]
MNIYLEEVFILNFLLDFMILYGTKRILKRNNKLIRIIIGSILGSFTTFLLLISISNLLLLILKLLISVFLIIISFGMKDIIRNTLYFYLISIILGGSFYLFDISNNSIILIGGSFIVISIIIKEFLNYKEVFTNKYLVTIIYKKKKYNLEGFIDTGNRLRDSISKKDVILVNLDIKSNEILYVPYKALNTSGIIPCIRPDKVIINNKEFNDVLVGLSRDKFILDYNCILPNRLKEELC